MRGRTNVRLTAGLVTLALCCSELASYIPALAVGSRDEYSVDHEIVTSWDGGYQAELTLNNLSDKDMTGWEISFTIPAEITDSWGGAFVLSDSVEYEDESDESSVNPADSENPDGTENSDDAQAGGSISNMYVVTAGDYNSTIPAGGSITVGYVANGDSGDITDIEVDYTLATDTSNDNDNNEDDEENESDDSNENIQAEPSGSIYVGSCYTVEVLVPQAWEHAYNTKLVITNTSDETLHNWGFIFKTDDSVTGLYNATELSAHDGTRLFKNAGYNQDIPAGGTVEVGYTAYYGDSFDVPDEFALASFERSVEMPEYRVETFVTDEWDDGALAGIVIENISDKAIEDWKLEFDSDMNISRVWDGVLVSHDGDHYIIRNADYAQNIAIGDSWTVGMEISGSISDIENVIMTEVSVDTDLGMSCTVTFDCCYDNVFNAPDTMVVIYGEQINRPLAPNLAGYLFKGWYIDSSYMELYDFSQSVTNDIVLYAKWEQMNDNLNDEVIDIGDIEYLRANDQIDVTYYDNGTISSIYGDFCGKKIFSITDASLVLNASSSLWGTDFSASESEIFVQTMSCDGKTTFYYVYSPTVNGISVYGSQIKIMVDNAGTVKALFNSYEDGIRAVECVPEITADEATQIAFESLMQRTDVNGFIEQAFNRALFIYGDVEKDDFIEEFRQSTDANTSMYIHCFSKNETPCLIYEVTLRNDLVLDEDVDESNLLAIDFDYSFYILANKNAGQLYRTVSNKKNLQISVDDSLGQTRNIEVEMDGDSYKMIDTERKITTYKSTYTKVSFFFKKYELPGEIETFACNTAPEPEAVSVHANMEVVYDYYKNVLGRDSYDDNGTDIIVSYGYGEEERNATWDSELGLIYFDKKGGMSKALDITAHEYTHAVIDNIVYTLNEEGVRNTMEYFGETGALNESYADIMGAIIEGKDGADRWNIAEDSGKVLRNMADPSSHDQSESYSEIGSSEWSWDEGVDDGGVHIHSGIINKAAYLMMTDNRTTDITSEKWAKVFYRSLFNLPVNATFLQAREAIIISAKEEGLNRVKLQAIKDAFDTVGVVEDNSVRIVLVWGQTPTDLDSHLVGPNSLSDTTSRFHLYFSNQIVKLSESGACVADLDYDDTTSWGPEIVTIHNNVPGVYYYYVYDFSNGGVSNSRELANSGAKVRIYIGAEGDDIYEFYIEPNNIGTYWNVFSLKIEEDASVEVTPIESFSVDTVYY